MKTPRRGWEKTATDGLVLALELAGAVLLLLAGVVVLFAALTYDLHRQALLTRLAGVAQIERNPTAEIREALLTSPPGTTGFVANFVTNSVMHEAKSQNKRSGYLDDVLDRILLAVWLSATWTKSDLDALYLNYPERYRSDGRIIAGAAQISDDMFGKPLHSLDAEELNCVRWVLRTGRIYEPRFCTKIHSIPSYYKRSPSPAQQEKPK